jgi:hypothetical protein
MSLEFYLRIAAVLSLGLLVPLAVRAYMRKSDHFFLCGLSFAIGYTLLLAVFIADVIVTSPLSPLLRFSRGFTAGMAVGLLLSGAVLAFFDAVHEGRVQNKVEK